MISLARNSDMKLREDMRRRAKESDISVGEIVLLRNDIFPNKLTPTFESTESKVLERNNNEVVLFGDGKTFRSYISHIKKIPDYLDSGLSSSESPNSIKMKSHLELCLKLKNIGEMWGAISNNTQK